MTGFFRDPEGFDALARSVFPRLTKDRGAHEAIRIWVPGCSTGEEAYSLVICLLEFLGHAHTSVPIQMFATDLSDAGIARARAGLFPVSIEHEVSPERLRRFFVKTDGQYQISKGIRDACVFAQHDVTRDPPFSKLDLISCCNVLIYLTVPLQERVIPIFHYALKPAGVLKLGPSESVGQFTNLFAAIDKKQRIYERKPGPSGHRGFGLSGDKMAAHARDTHATPQKAASESAAIEKEADRLILGRYAPAGVVVNADFEIVQYRGKTGHYLEATPGAASLSIFKMAREGLSPALRRVLQEAVARGGPANVRGVKVKTNGAARDVGLEVVPIGPAEGAKDRHYLILFVEERPSRAGREPAPTRAAGRATSRERRVAQLTQELADLRQQAQTISEEHEAAMEELRAATEEAQSSNEELQSTNEELETAREELQATNEELTTLNDELNSRNRDLGQLNNDLRNLLASLHVPILMIDSDLRIRRLTPIAEKVLNLVPGDIGRPIGDLRLSVEIPGLESLLRVVGETLTPEEREVQARDGRWYSVRVRPYRTADNRIDGAVISCMDIDDIKRASDAAKAARDQAEAIIATVREPLVVLDAGLRVVTTSRSFYTTFQVKPEETERRLLYDLGNLQWDIPELRRLLEEILPRENTIEDFEVEHDFDTIGRRTMLLNARRVLSAAGEPALILLAIDDVTERRREEEATRRLGAIVADSEDAIIGKTLDGVITSWNRGAEQMFGYSAVEIIGRPVTVVIPPDRLDEEADLLAGLRRGTGAHCETVRARKDGARVDVSLTVSPIRDTADQVVGVSTIARDISDRVQRERERAELLAGEQAARAEAETATRSKDKFLAMLSHELRTPLNAMLGWARMMRAGTLDPAATAKALDVIERNTVLQVRLIEDLLDVSRIAAGTLQLQARPVMVAPAVQATLATCKPAADAKGLVLTSAIDETAGPVRGDPARLQQIAGNLVSNAIKFTPSGGQIDVRLARRERAVELSVRDTGTGVPPEHLPGIFDRFGRADARSQSQGGLGLGLAIVRHLVELHGGTVHAESPGPGQGATFTVTLPITDERPDAAVLDSPATASGSGRLPALTGVRVLVVDDEADTREVLKAVLTQCGAEVTAVAGASAALEALQQARFDVMVSDIFMPEGDGYELIKSVRALDPGRGGRIPALALTAYTRVVDRTAALAAGFQQHAAKPIEPAELAAAVATLAAHGASNTKRRRTKDGGGP